MRTLSEIKADLVWAHYCKDWDAAARLSQEKEKAKKRKVCIDCGARIRSHAMRCFIHSTLHRYYEKTLGPIHT